MSPNLSSTPASLQVFANIISRSQISCERIYSKLKYILSRMRNSRNENKKSLPFMLMGMEKALLMSISNNLVINNVANSSKHVWQRLSNLESDKLCLSTTHVYLTRLSFSSRILFHKRGFRIRIVKFKNKIILPSSNEFLNEIRSDLLV